MAKWPKRAGASVGLGDRDSAGFYGRFGQQAVSMMAFSACIWFQVVMLDDLRAWANV